MHTYKKSPIRIHPSPQFYSRPQQADGTRREKRSKKLSLWRGTRRHWRTMTQIWSKNHGFKKNDSCRLLLILMILIEDDAPYKPHGMILGTPPFPIYIYLRPMIAYIYVSNLHIHSCLHLFFSFVSASVYALNYASVFVFISVCIFV